MESSDKKSNCDNQENCIEMLQSIIDGEASAEQRYEFLTNHVERCMPCFKTYHLEMAIKDLVKAKCSGQCPDGLVDEIKARIATLR